MPTDIYGDQYFATDTADHLIDRCEREISTWGTTTTGNTMFSRILEAYWRNMAAYYSCLIEPNSYDTALGFTGEKGELVRLLIPKARTLIRQFVGIATRQRYAFDVVTDINDATPMETARLGKSIVNAEVEKHSIEMLAERICEGVSVKGQVWVSNTWATDRGEIWGRADDKSVIYSGGNRFELHDLHDVIFNWGHTSTDDLEWIIIKRKYNRWNLIAQFPELAEHIRGLPTVRSERMLFPVFNYMATMDDQDFIYVREFYHKPTPALPFGRMCIYGNHDTVFYDGKNKYECIPAELFRFQNLDSTLLGYPMLSSLLPAQQMLDHEVSVISTNHSAFGVQSVLVPKGADISAIDIKEGTNFIQYTPQNAEGGGKPEPLQLTATPAEFFNFIQSLGGFLDEISMINSTLRGQPPANVTSGAMAATLAAQALEFINSDTKGLTIGIEKLMTRSIENYKLFATAEQIIDVVGEGNTSSVQTFQSQSIQGIKKVKCRVGNPLMATISGRLQLGESILPMLQQGNFEGIAKYFGLIEGAPIDSMFESEVKENVAIQQEVEALLKGENVFPLITDNHPLYIREYRKILFNAQIRRSSQLTKHIIDIMMERIKLESMCPPELKAMLRNQPIPQQPPPPQAAIPPNIKKAPPASQTQVAPEKVGVDQTQNAMAQQATQQAMGA